MTRRAACQTPGPDERDGHRGGAHAVAGGAAGGEARTIVDHVSKAYGP